MHSQCICATLNSRWTASKLNWKLTFFPDPHLGYIYHLILFVVRANAIIYKLARANVCIELNWIELNWIFWRSRALRALDSSLALNFRIGLPPNKFMNPPLAQRLPPSKFLPTSLSEYSCLCGMISAQTGLKFWKQTIIRQVTSELSQDQLLNDIWHEWKVWYWPIVFYFSRIQPWFLETRHNHSRLLR